RHTRNELDEGRCAPRDFYIPTTGALGFFCFFCMYKLKELGIISIPLTSTCKKNHDDASSQNNK
ncbi:hypothetical protein, partial [Enterobacter hormaechei]|uniref:hypothetical protein n=1 Tax=Enterobacter hormaechei TaxID=158836 RepID=UPI001EDB6242